MHISKILLLFGGKGREEAIFQIIRSGFTVDAVIVPNNVSKGLKNSILRIQERGIVVVEVSKKNLMAQILHYDSDTLISIGFPFLLQTEILDNFELCLNIHPTLLPKYRGPTTGAYIIRNSEQVAGATVHIIDQGMDTGSIVKQQIISLCKFDTVKSMQKKVYAIEPQLICEALDFLVAGGDVIQQDEKEATIYLKKLHPEDSEINPKESLFELYDMIRSCDPENYPAFFYIEGQKICVKLWREKKTTEERQLGMI